MLTKDPDIRFTFDRIKGHSFSRAAKIIKLSLTKELDHRILVEMEQLGHKKNDVIDYLARNKHNSTTATYYLLQQKNMKQA